MATNERLKKVLFVLQLPPPVHGASLMNEHIVSSILLKKNFDTEVINLKFSDSIKKLEKFSIRKIFKALYYAGVIVRKVRGHRPDLVYFTLAPKGFAFYRDAFYIFILKMMKRKIVYHMHGKGIKNTAQRDFISKAISGWMFKDIDVICMSEKLTDDVKSVFKHKPYIVPYGIQVQPPVNGNGSTYGTDVNGVAGADTIPNILYLANYIRTKGVLDLIEALKLLKDQGAEFRARLVGAPGDLSVKDLEDLLKKLDLSDMVEVIGPRYGEEKFTEFRNADLFVFPTYYSNEAFPLVNLEAMQFGLPVISTVEGGISDMFQDSEAGFIIETRQPKILAEKIDILLKDKDLRVEMGKKSAERFAGNFTLGHFEQNISNAINKMLVVS